MAILTLIGCCSGFPVGAAESHCAADETIMFSCNTGKKIISVCGSKTASTSSQYLQYRFGPKGAPDLLYPDKKVHPGNNVRARTLTFAGGGGAYIRFQRDQYAYVVYTALGRGWGEKAGVVVERDHKQVTSLPCKGPVTSELGPDLFEQAGLPEDQEGFDLP
ncbi:MAG: hypothetical protein ACRERU_08900 [Methylococcales bacterium]